MGPFKNEKSKAEKKVKETEKKVKEKLPKKDKKKEEVCWFPPFRWF